MAQNEGQGIHAPGRELVFTTVLVAHGGSICAWECVKEGMERTGASGSEIQAPSMTAAKWLLAAQERSPDVL